MRRLVVVLSLSLMASVSTGSVMAATSSIFEARFTQHLGRGTGAFSGPCDIAFCGTGQVVGYGEAELTIVATGAEPTSAPGCGFALAVTGIATIELEDGSALALDEAGIYCLPGGSHFAPGNFFVSYGNPLDIRATYTVVSGSGVFAGAAGSGTTTLRQAGDTQVAGFSGTLSIG
jgi:hypothetical protein